MRKQGTDSQADAQQNEARALAELANLQRRTEPDEEERAEKALGDAEQLPRQPARCPDCRHHKAEREAGQHDRHVRRGRQCAQHEQDEKAEPQFQGEPVLLRIAVQPLAQPTAVAGTQHQEQNDRAGARSPTRRARPVSHRAGQ